MAYISTDSAYQPSADPNQDPYQLPNPYGSDPYQGIPPYMTASARGRTSVDQLGSEGAMTQAPAPNPGQWSNLQQQIFGSMPGIPQAPPFSYAAFQAPAPFAAPSTQDVLAADPGFNLRLQEGVGAIQNSAAARGVQNTGGSLLDILKYGQGLGSQEYSNAYDRALGTYNTNFDTALRGWLANAGNAFNTYATNYNSQVQNPYLAAMNQYQTGMQGQGQLFSQQFQTANA